MKIRMGVFLEAGGENALTRCVITADREYGKLSTVQGSDREDIGFMDIMLEHLLRYVTGSAHEADEAKHSVGAVARKQSDDGKRGERAVTEGAESGR